ncbi:hypothetical protein SEA_JUMBO_96 [Gordonia phage Jumbo]|uniref:Uncharacterized protein n=1 Tax=Gordonia phage Jumbo TaxID=1887650 RepID=A0A1B3B0R7_9CAUD|nr:hypothetical protein BIZ69_gp096 [Gordonia phage Jumbo]AOE44603.1 hypothetical protein SEA_JUMBO_96 [Gordonia phage Jumbo]
MFFAKVRQVVTADDYRDDFTMVFSAETRAEIETKIKHHLADILFIWDSAPWSVNNTLHSDQEGTYRREIAASMTVGPEHNYRTLKGITLEISSGVADAAAIERLTAAADQANRAALVADTQ